MMQPYHILADKGDLVQLIVVLAIIGASAIARKIAAKAQQNKGGQENRQRRSAGEAQQTVPAARPPRPPARQPRRLVPPRSDEALAGTFRRQVGMSRQELPLRPVVEPEAPGVQEMHPLPRGAGAAGLEVETEMERQRRRLQMDELRRQQRLTSRAPQEADTRGIESRLLHVPQADQPPSTEAASQLPSALAAVQLQSAQAAAQLPSTIAAAQVPQAIQQLHQAVIWYEILSPPKALRRGREPWGI